MSGAKIIFAHLEIFLGVVYRPPQSNVDVLIKLNTFLSKLGIRSKRVIMTGDFNIPDIDWDVFSATGPNITISSTPLDLTFSSNFTQVIREYTRSQGSANSILDLFFLSERMLQFPYTTSILSGISNNSMLPLSFIFENVLLFRNCRLQTYQDFHHADDEAILDELSFHLDAFFFSLSLGATSSTNTLWLEFKKSLFECINNYVPKKTKKTTNT